MRGNLREDAQVVDRQGSIPAHAGQPLTARVKPVTDVVSFARVVGAATAPAIDTNYRVATLTDSPSNKQPVEVGGKLHIKIDSDGRPRVRRLEKQGQMDIDVYTGPIMVTP